MPLLDWRPAVQRDAGALSVFECTEPPRRGRVLRHESKHAKPWEYQVQRYIREVRHKCTPEESTWVGVDRSGIGGVFQFERVDGWSSVQVRVAAVALHHRFTGGGVADELLRTCLDEVTARSIDAGEPEVTITANIHELNHASQGWARRNGLIHTGSLEDGCQYQVWQKAIPLL